MSVKVAEKKSYLQDRGRLRKSQRGRLRMEEGPWGSVGALGGGLRIDGGLTLVGGYTLFTLFLGLMEEAAGNRCGLKRREWHRKPFTHS